MERLPDEIIQKILSFIPIDELDKLYQEGFPLPYYETRIFWTWVLQNNFSYLSEMTSEIINDIGNILYIKYKSRLCVELIIQSTEYAVQSNNLKLVTQLFECVCDKPWYEYDMMHTMQHIILHTAAVYDRYELAKNFKYSNIAAKKYIDAAVTAAIHGNIDSTIYFLGLAPRLYKRISNTYSLVMYKALSSSTDYHTKINMIDKLMDYDTDIANGINLYKIENVILFYDIELIFVDHILERLNYNKEQLKIFIDDLYAYRRIEIAHHIMKKYHIVNV